MAQNNQTPQSNDRDAKPYSASKTQGQEEQMDASQPGVMGDWTEEQNLNQAGDPSKRIKEDEVQEAFKNQGQGSQGGKSH